MSNVISMKQLLEAGVHFGHPTKKWNPKMKKFIYTARNDIYIINLEKTVQLIDEAYAFVKKSAEEGKNILFVGTKKQAQEAVMQEAQKCGMYYVNNRWLGGMLTNFATMRSRVERLNRINQMERMNEFSLLPKKEVMKLIAERDKLEQNLGGVKEMRGLPGVLFVVDPKKEHIAVAEARSLNIPIVGIVDTNCDPDEVDHVIPGNDDAIRAIKLIAGAIADAVIEAKEGEDGLNARREVEAKMKAEAIAATAQPQEEVDFKERVAPLMDKIMKPQPQPEAQSKPQADAGQKTPKKPVKEQTAANVKTLGTEAAQEVKTPLEQEAVEVMAALTDEAGCPTETQG